MKKSFKKVISVILAVALIASLGITAFAAEGCQLNVTGPAELNLGSNANGNIKAVRACTGDCGCKAAGCGEFTYESSDENVVTVNSRGQVQAVAVGTATITVKCGKATDCSAEGTCTVKVMPKAPTVSRGRTYYVLTGETLALKATASSGNSVTSPDLEYSWKVGNTACGSADTVEVDTSKAGNFTYTCSVVETVNGLQSAAATATFKVVVLDKYEITVASRNGADAVSVGGTLQLSASVKENIVSSDNTSTNAKDVTGSMRSKINWATDTEYLTLSNTTTGSTAIVTGKKNNVSGVDVTASITDGGSTYSGKIRIKVQETITVKLGSDSISLLVGNSSTDAAVSSVTVGRYTAYPKGTALAVGRTYIYTVSYENSDPNVIDLDFKTGKVTALKGGTAKVTASVTVEKDGTIVGYTTKACEVSVINDSFDIVYNVKLGSSTALTDKVFDDWFKSVAGSDYKLSFVNFGTPSNSAGSFKNGASSVSASIDYYVAGRSGSGVKYLANTVFTAPNYAYGTNYVAIPFTCVGTNSTYSYSTFTRSGTLYFFFTYGNVNDISYDVKTVQALSNSDFISTYRVATGSSTASGFTIKLLDLPKNGAFYEGYVNANNKGYKVTTTGSYDVVNSSYSLSGSVAELTYVPLSARNGSTDTVRYAAFDNYGNVIYVGSIIFKNGVVSNNVYSEGRTFTYSDFYRSSDVDPIIAVSFDQPAKGGKLFVNFKYGRGTLVKDTDEFYTKDAINGIGSVSTVTFVPDAALKDNAEITYTARTKYGQTYSGTITMAVKSKTASSYFTDVTEKNTGKWSANAIDFAYRWNLVNGNSTTAKTYAPSDSMTRAQFVTILYRAAGSPAISYSSPFKDVTNKNAYYYNATLWAYYNGIITGNTTTTFNPDGKLTREQIAKMLYGFDYIINNKTTPTGAVSIKNYEDNAKVSAYAVGAMQWAVGNGIITSAVSDKLTLNPSGTASRAQVATMLHRYLCTF